MKLYFNWLIVLLMMCKVSVAQNAVTVGNLSCNSLHNPIAIDDANPALSWIIKTEIRDFHQSYFQVIIASDSDKLNKNVGDLWNSGKVKSNESINISYKGVPLKSYQTCWWKVKVWGSAQATSNWSTPNKWRMAVLANGDWKGNWIASDLTLNPYQKVLKALPDFGMEPETEIWDRSWRIREQTKNVDTAPAVYFRKEFTVGKKIASAYATICGLGFYELHLNGNKVGNEYLNPAPSDYQKRVYYNTFDVTQQITNHKNAIGVMVGNGWYNLIIPHVLRYYAADYIEPPKLRMELKINYADGSSTSIVTDDTWKYSTNGQLQFNCLLGGETYNNTINFSGWDEPGFADDNWKDAQPTKAPEGKISAQNLSPVCKTGVSAAQSLSYRGDTAVIDFGRELTGWCRLKFHGQKGAKIEVAYPGASSHTLGRYQTCRYVLNGDSSDVFESRFSYNGFKTIEITGLKYKPELADFTAISINTNFPVTGSFLCSNDTINRLQNIILQTAKNYVVHIPNDPTREKAGWSQDVQNAFDLMAYNFDCYSMYKKWQLDFLDIQHANGYVPPVVPGRFDGPTINGPWWSGMIVYQPWKVYQYYGDKKLLEESYPAMKKYVGYLQSIAVNNIVEWGLGDWMEPGSVRPVKTPVPLTSTLAYYYYATIVAKTAVILQKNAEAKAYLALAEKIKQAYNEKFYNCETGRYALGSQASQLMSLYLGAVPAQNQQKVKDALIAQIQKDSMHLSTGFVATPFLLNGLCNMGYEDIAYTIATRNTYPSWYDMVFNRGNSVMKETWNGGEVQMPSLGGSIGAWFYYSLAGIRASNDAPAFKSIVIDPVYNSSLSWVKANYHTPYGEIVVEWKKQNKQLEVVVKIPANTYAIVNLPTSNTAQIFEGETPIAQIKFIKTSATNNGKTALNTGSGTYHFTIKIKP